MGVYRVKGEIVKEFKQENCSYTYLLCMYTTDQTNST